MYISLYIKHFIQILSKKRRVISRKEICFKIRFKRNFSGQGKTNFGPLLKFKSLFGFLKKLNIYKCPLLFLLSLVQCLGGRKIKLRKTQALKGHLLLFHLSVACVLDFSERSSGVSSVPQQYMLNIKLPLKITTNHIGSLSWHILAFQRP